MTEYFIHIKTAFYWLQLRNVILHFAMFERNIIAKRNQITLFYKAICLNRIQFKI